jgi:hypothetical protein
MEIKKNETMKLFYGVQKSNNENSVEQNQSDLVRKYIQNTEKGTSRENFELDKIRNQVLNLHGEVKDIQTKISEKQIQIAFLEKIPNNNNWKEQLQDFLKGKFSDGIVLKPDPDLQSYLKRLGGEIRMLNNDMLTREIKLENIISSGLIDMEKPDISHIIVKDMAKAREVFSKIKTESISRVLKG